jgi:hypothetical protein
MMPEMEIKMEIMSAMVREIKMEEIEILYLREEGSKEIN